MKSNTQPFFYLKGRTGTKIPVFGPTASLTAGAKRREKVKKNTLYMAHTKKR